MLLGYNTQIMLMIIVVVVDVSVNKTNLSIYPQSILSLVFCLYGLPTTFSIQKYFVLRKLEGIWRKQFFTVDKEKMR
jgi:hypothetical protein